MLHENVLYTIPTSRTNRCRNVILIAENILFHYAFCRYKGPKPETVDWRAFCAEIEHVFQTPDLEKDPLKQPETYVPDSMVKQNFLSLETAQVADRAVLKVADQVSRRAKRTRLSGLHILGMPALG